MTSSIFQFLREQTDRQTYGLTQVVINCHCCCHPK